MSLSNFSSASFKKTEFRNVNLENSLFTDAKFDEVDFAEIAANGASFDGAIFIASRVSPRLIDNGNIERTQVFATRAEYRETFYEFRQIGKESTAVGDVADTRTPKNRYDVYFGTDRKPVIEQGAIVGFSGQRNGQVSFGICEVNVPEGHRMGSLGSPLWKRLLNRKDDRLSMEALIMLNEEMFFRHLAQQLGSMKVSERPTIFVHGFANSFEDSVLRAAQIGYDIGLGAGIGLFSWPSRGKKKHYAADEATAESSKYHLASFIEKFTSEFADSGINLIAHSMGCRCLLGALEALSAKKAAALQRIDQVILAAADVDVDAMKHLGIHPINSCKRTTSYVAGKDKALLLSEWLHDYPRVGVTPPTYLMNGLDTIVVNNADLGEFSHQYVGTSRTVLGDIHELFKSNRPPNERFSLEALFSGGCEYWKLKE